MIWPLIWIVSLAFLSVGARNFEEGMSIDGPLYAAISREIARSGEWFRLDARVPDFIPYNEHPHLAFWAQALIFKFLPAADWSARILGHLCYVAFLFLFFKRIKNLLSENAATFAVLFLWIWAPFSNFFSTFYLDPLALLLGALSIDFFWRGLQTQKLGAATLSGVFLSLVFVTKGLTALAFLLMMGILFLTWIFSKSLSEKTTPSTVRSRLIMASTLSIVGLFFAVLILALYFWAIRSSADPVFLETYWNRQMTSRFSNSWNWMGLIGANFWKGLLKDTYYLIVLVPIFFMRSRSKKDYFFPVVFFTSFALMYAPAARVGAQYSLMLLPPIAWALGVGTCETFSAKIQAASWQKWTLRLAVALVLLIQYLPFKTHHRPIPHLVPAIKEFFTKNPDLPRELLLYSDSQLDFVTSAPFAWYGDLKIFYKESLGVENVRLMLDWDMLNGKDHVLALRSVAGREFCPIPETANKELFQICK